MKLSLEFMVHLLHECYVTMPLYRGNFLPPVFAGKEFFSPKQGVTLSSSLSEGDHLNMQSGMSLQFRAGGQNPQPPPDCSIRPILFECKVEGNLSLLAECLDLYTAVTFP